MPSRDFGIGALAVAAFLPAREALANGRFPATSQVVTAPGNPDQLTVRATFGLLTSSDRGRDWGWICESAVGFDGEEDPEIGVTANGTLLAGLYEGLALSADGGCSWRFAPEFTGLAVADLTVRADDPHAAFAVGWSSTTNDAGATAFDSRVYGTSDDGAHWTQTAGALDPSLLVETIDAAPSDPSRLYVSGVRGVYAISGAALLTSRDGGATFDETAIPIDPNLESGAYIAAVDPTNADRLYVRTWPISRLLVSSDAGQTFAPVLTFAGEMKGFALSADGTTIYAGGPDDGLWTADASDLQFRSIAPTSIECLASAGAELLACSNDEPFALGASTDDGQTFTTLLRLENVSSVLSCNAGTSTAACSAQLPALCATLQSCDAPDASVVDAADASVVDAAAAPGHDVGPSSAVGGGCAIDGPPRDSPWRWTALVFAVSLMWRTSRRCAPQNRTSRRAEP